MLIDSAYIDRLRVNFVTQFHTENTTILAANEISAIIDNYPREMTSQVRQWFNEQQKGRVTVPLASDDLSKTIESFNQYVQDLEDRLREYHQDESSTVQFKVGDCSSHAVRKRTAVFAVARRFVNSWRTDQPCPRVFPRSTNNVFFDWRNRSKTSARNNQQWKLRFNRRRKQSSCWLNASVSMKNRFKRITNNPSVITRISLAIVKWVASTRRVLDY